MPFRDTSGIGERASREMVEADLSVAFSLVDMAETEGKGDPRIVAQLLSRAEKMLTDIRGRLQRLPAAQSQTVAPRCEELSHAIDKARIEGPAKD